MSPQGNRTLILGTEPACRDGLYMCYLSVYGSSHPATEGATVDNTRPGTDPPWKLYLDHQVGIDDLQMMICRSVWPVLR